MQSSPFHVCISDLLDLYECMHRTNRNFADCERLYAKLHKCVKIVATMQTERASPATVYPPYPMR